MGVHAFALPNEEEASGREDVFGKWPIKGIQGNGWKCRNGVQTPFLENLLKKIKKVLRLSEFSV